LEHTLNNGRSVSLHKAWQQSTGHNERQRLTELRVICTIAEGWAMLNCEPVCLIPVPGSSHEKSE